MVLYIGNILAIPVSKCSIWYAVGWLQLCGCHGASWVKVVMSILCD